MTQLGEGALITFSQKAGSPQNVPQFWFRWSPWWVSFIAHHWYYSGLPAYSNGPASLSNTPQQEWKSWQLSVLQSYFSSWEHQANFCYRMPWWETIQRDHSQNICRYQMLYLEHLPSSVSFKKNLFSFPVKGHAFLTWSILYPKFSFSSSCPILVFSFQYLIRRIHRYPFQWSSLYKNLQTKRKVNFRDKCHIFKRIFCVCVYAHNPIKYHRTVKVLLSNFVN